jgi:tRNA 2-thiouridine synthesizing protein A
MIELDVRGLACPIPVVKTKEAMDKNPGKQLTVLADAAVAKENISRYASTKKYSVTMATTAKEEYSILLTPPA